VHRPGTGRFVGAHHLALRNSSIRVTTRASAISSSVFTFGQLVAHLVEVILGWQVAHIVLHPLDPSIVSLQALERVIHTLIDGIDPGADIARLGG